MRKWLSDTPWAFCVLSVATLLCWGYLLADFGGWGWPASALISSALSAALSALAVGIGIKNLRRKINVVSSCIGICLGLPLFLISVYFTALVVGLLAGWIQLVD